MRASSTVFVKASSRVNRDFAGMVDGVQPEGWLDCDESSNGRLVGVQGRCCIANACCDCIGRDSEPMAHFSIFVSARDSQVPIWTGGIFSTFTSAATASLCGAASRA